MLAAIFFLLYAAKVIPGLHTAAQASGTIAGLPLDGPVSIARDRRGIPYIRATTTHDLFFAQGFAEASDRLFQMEVTRRYAYGTLAEVFGAKALSVDEDMRAVDIRHVVARQWQHADPFTRRALQAFSDGVDAAIARQPQPVEFRMLLYSPARWTPLDSLAVSLVAMLELSDSWHDIEARDAAWRALSRACFDLEYPLSDARYDTSIDGTQSAHRSGNKAGGNCPREELANAAMRPRTGSNAWAASARYSSSGHALIANDPHVDLTLPGIWYVVNLRAPGFHAAGAVIPGLPGVNLGHNERIAWALTNAQAATTVLYNDPSPARRDRVIERFGVRFGRAQTRVYYRDATEYSVADGNPQGVTFARWPPYWERATPIATTLAIDRAYAIPGAMRALAAYRGSPENFIVADTHGAVAYHLAGDIPDDPAWGRYVHPRADMRHAVRLLPFASLPARAASSNTVLVSANNRMYGHGYRYRLSASFEPPYRAYRIAALLHAKARYTWEYFARMQMDAYSPVDAEIARHIARITADSRFRRWNGRFTPGSRSATLAHRIRVYFADERIPLAMLLSDLRRSDRHQQQGAARDLTNALWALQQSPPRWGDAGRVEVDHPFSNAWYGILRGMPLPGDGDEFTIHLQEPGFAQGFRAVWDTGNWDAGGIVIPSGESGEPGSPHYDDLARPWIAGRMEALPFSPAMVRRATVATLELRPTP